MKINLIDNDSHLSFAPLSLTRPIAELRTGIFTNTERYKHFLPECEIGYKSEAYLSTKYKELDCDLFIIANLIPNEDFIGAICNLEKNQSLLLDGHTLAKRGNGKENISFLGESPVILKERWELFQLNNVVLKNDFDLITNNRNSQKLSKSNTLIGSPSALFIEEGAQIEGAILNTTTGPIYVGKNAEIMEGSLIRGGLALCENACIKMGAKIYGATSIGPFCKVGGELNNVIFQSYSNKGHDGFLGNSVIGSWCNLGADTNTSNLKNNYSNVKTYSYIHKSEIQTNIQFMGLYMGDYSKTGINTMFNTATNVGVCCNIFGSGFPDKHIPSFSWVNSNHASPFDLKKSIIAAKNMMSRRELKMEQSDIDIFSHLFALKP